MLINTYLIIKVIIIIIIIIVVTIVTITFIQGIYNYIPETNNISREFSVGIILYLQFVIHVMLFPPLNVLHFCISTFRNMLQCTIRLFSAVP